MRSWKHSIVPNPGSEALRLINTLRILRAASEINENKQKTNRQTHKYGKCEQQQQINRNSRNIEKHVSTKRRSERKKKQKAKKQFSQITTNNTNCHRFCYFEYDTRAHAFEIKGPDSGHYQICPKAELESRSRRVEQQLACNPSSRDHRKLIADTRYPHSRYTYIPIYNPLSIYTVHHGAFAQL